MPLPTLFLLLILHVVAPPPAATVAVVVHPDVPVQALDTDELLRVFLMEQTYWTDGTAIQLFDYNGKTEAKSVFYDELGRQPRVLKRSWMRLILAGEASSPKTVSNVTAMHRGIAETPGAIGYLPIDAVDDRVVVVAYLPR